MNDCCPSRPRHLHILLGLVSVPWCCVLTFSLFLFSAGGSVLGLAFDEWYHQWMWIILPILSIVHLIGIVRFARDAHRSRRDGILLIATTILFVATATFHFTDIHDSLVDHADEKHEHHDNHH